MSAVSLSTKGNQAEAQNGRTLLELMSKLDIYSDPTHVRKTGIICTIGPACNSVLVLKELMKAGMCVARLNFSHGDYETHAKNIAAIRQAAAEVEMNVAIALDTKGPEIRTGLLAGYKENPVMEVTLVAGKTITLTSDPAFKDKCTAEILYIDYEDLWRSVEPGKLVYIDDGLISLQVISKEVGKVECTIVNDGNLGSKKGVNLPHSPVHLPAVSEKDKADLLFSVEQGLDMIFASFTRKAADVKEIRGILGDKGSKMWIISKIENHEGMINFDEILDECEGIMVARGDLGIEIPAEKVFLAQKMMIARCSRAGKPVICATQMLESMVKNPRPTRAEGTDVANAVLDGSDCVMLSGETAKGLYPVQAVTVMGSICREAESAFLYKQFRDELRLLSSSKIMSMTEACSLAAVEASVSLNAACILCLTTTGSTARFLAKWRPICPILAVTRFPMSCRQMRLHRAVHSLLYPTEKDPAISWSQDIDDRFDWAIEQGKKLGILKAGDVVVGVHGWQAGSGFTNTVRLLNAS